MKTKIRAVYCVPDGHVKHGRLARVAGNDKFEKDTL